MFMFNISCIIMYIKKYILCWISYVCLQVRNCHTDLNDFNILLILSEKTINIADDILSNN